MFGGGGQRGMSSPQWETRLASWVDILGTVPSPPSVFSKSPSQVILPDTPFPAPQPSTSPHFLLCSESVTT